MSSSIIHGHGLKGMDIGKFGVEEVVMSRAPENLLLVPTESVVTEVTIENFAKQGPGPTIRTAAMKSGNIRHIMAIHNIARTTDQVGIDMSISQKHQLTYDYTRGTVTNADIHDSVAHFAVKPRLQMSKITSLRTAFSVEDFAKSLSIKLPKLVTITNNVAQTNANQNRVPLATYNQFESLRGLVAQHALNDDLGSRLFNMAKVVLHATVCKIQTKMHTMPQHVNNTSMNSILTAECINMSTNDFNTNLHLYIGNEMNETYRAFLLMGVQDLALFVGSAQSVYSRMSTKSEVRSESGAYSPVTFVRLMGDMPASVVVPPNIAYMRVLNDPKLALGYYYAYATSLGLHNVASAVLLQCAITPFMFTKRAVIPYKIQATHAKTDAYMYLMEEIRAAPVVKIDEIENIVGSASVVADAVKATLAAYILNWKADRIVDITAVNSGILAALSQADKSQKILHASYESVLGNAACLEWINPFRESTQSTYLAITRAWRINGWLLSRSNKQAQKLLCPMFCSGFTMKNVYPAVSTTIEDDNNDYRGIFMLQLLAGEPLSLESENLSQTIISQQAIAAAPRYRSWCAQVKWIRFATSTVPTSEGLKSPVRLVPPPQISQGIQPYEYDLGNPHVPETTTRPTTPVGMGGMRAFDETRSEPSTVRQWEPKPFIQQSSAIANTNVTSVISTPQIKASTSVSNDTGTTALEEEIKIKINALRKWSEEETAPNIMDDDIPGMFNEDGTIKDTAMFSPIPGKWVGNKGNEFNVTILNK